jgi:hypothetical protein
VEPFLGKNHQFKTDDQSDSHDCKPERQTQTTNVSITISRKQHSTTTILHRGKIFCPDARRAIAGRQPPDLEARAQLVWIPWFFPGCYKSLVLAGAGASGTTHCQMTTVSCQPGLFAQQPAGPSRPRSPVNIFALFSPIPAHLGRYDRPRHRAFMTFFCRAGWPNWKTGPHFSQTP